jgi:hypothetical protein
VSIYFDISHTTHYRYAQPVELGEHRVFQLCGPGAAARPGGGAEVCVYVFSRAHRHARAGSAIERPGQARFDEGVQTPHETLALQSGTCGDFATLMIEAIRLLGYAALRLGLFVHAGAGRWRAARLEHRCHSCLGPRLLARGRLDSI